MNIFYPDIYAKNIFEIDYEKLPEKTNKIIQVWRNNNAIYKKLERVK